MDCMLDSSKSAQFTHNMAILSKKNVFLKIIVGVLIIILIGIILNFFGYLQKEDSEVLLSKIKHYEKIQRLNAYKIFAYDALMNQTKIIEAERYELLKEVSKFQESIKNAQQIHENGINLLNQCKNNTKIQINLFELKKQDELQILETRIQDECVIMVGELYHINGIKSWIQLQYLANNTQDSPANKLHKPITTNDTIQNYCNETEEITNLTIENQNIRAAFFDLTERYHEEFFSVQTKIAASRGEADPWLSNLNTLFIRNNAGHNNINQILIIAHVIIIFQFLT